MNIPREEILLRRNLISQLLLDEVYSGSNDQILLQLQETCAFSDAVMFAIEKKYQYVLLGFLRVKDLFEELTQDVKLDSKTALVVYQTLDEKIFSRLRGEIENTYKMFQTENVSEGSVAPLKTQERVVLHRDLPPETVTLNFKDVPTQKEDRSKSEIISPKPTPQTTQDSPHLVNLSNTSPAPLSVPVPPPASLGTYVQKNTSNPVSQVGVAPALPQNQSVVSSVKMNQSQKTEPQTVSPSMFAIPGTSPSSDGPVVLHKKEEVSSVGQSTAGKAYRQMSFGSFMGAFKSPQNKEANISRAEIEMPTANQAVNTGAPSQQVPFSVKKYDVTPPTPQQGEQAKVVHYTFEDTK